LLTIVQVGNKVTFELGTDVKSGKRRARNVSVMGGKGGKGRMPAAHARPGPYGKGPPPMARGHHMMPLPHERGGRYDDRGGRYGPAGGYALYVPPVDYGGKGGLPGPQAFIGQVLEGTVLQWKDFWGWISCPLFGGDLFAHKDDLKNGQAPPPGTRVTFTPGTDNKGRMRALMIYNKGGHSGGASRGGDFRGGASGGAKRKAGKADSKPREGEAEFEQLEGQLIDGEVSHWKSPWGWIRSDHFPGEIFAHIEEVEGREDLTVGQQVMFEVARDAKSGRWRAMRIQLE